MKAPTRMTAAHVSALRQPVEEHLRMADARRFGQLLGLFEGDRLRLSRVLKACYPSGESGTQLSLLRNFRTELNRAFRKAKLDAAFVVDTRKRSAPEERFCWFEGTNAAEPLLTRFVETQAHVTDPAKSIEPRATFAPARRPVRYVVVSAEEDEPTASEFVRLLRLRMRGSRSCAFEGWATVDLVAGQNRAAERKKHEEASQIAIVLVSPSLVADGRIRARLAALKDEGRPLFPIPLIAVDAQRQELGALQGLESCPRDMRAFREHRGKPAKEKFALAAWQDLEIALEKAPLRLSRLAMVKSPGPYALLDDSVRTALELPRHLVDARGRISSLRLRGDADGVDRELQDGSAGTGSQPKGESIEAVSYLQAWAADRSAPPFFALLGDVGMGKTTTCRLLTLRMLEAHGDDPAAPLPIYLDLRRFSWDHSTRFSLDSILEEVLRKSFHAGTSPVPSPDDVIEHVQRQGAVVLFDGLDEVIVHMPPKIAQDFIRELWRILPPATRESRESPRESPRELGERRGKLLISCRSHYFRRVWEQNTMLCGEEREGLRSSDYRALVLVPFDSKQVEEYLRHSVSNLDVDRALDLIRSVHNLSELAERPFTLALIGEFLPELERKSRAGAVIQGVDLYEAMVTRWLLRDQGKHQFNTVHKELLMERLAAALWTGARREWSCEQLENWLDDTVDSDDRFRDYRGKERDVLKEDLRTATFLVRPGAETFRFAHTSLQEYFLARHLYRALIASAEDRWVIDMPSDETFEFLAQLLNRDGAQKQLAEKTLGALLGRYRPLASEAALRLWMQSRTKPDGLRRPARIDLRGAKLRGWRFAGSTGRPLDLRSVDLRGADLRDAVFSMTDFADADFSGARAVRAEFHDVRLAGSNFGTRNGEGADLTGTLWRKCKLTNVDLRFANVDGSRFIRCDFSHVSWPASRIVPVFAACHDNTGEKSTLSKHAAVRLDVFTGHYEPINACAVAPDSRRIVSGASDGTLRVWDAITGEVQLILEGHGDIVTACAISTDGQRIISGDANGELRIWDAASGNVLLEVDAGQGAVWACALSEDGRRLFSATSNHTLLVHDVADGQELLVSQGQGHQISACDMSRDGRLIVFGSADGTLHVQDGTSGELLHVLKGHKAKISSCAVSADGRRVVSTAFEDGFRVWDAETGEVLLTVEGDKSVISARISPDGQRVVTWTGGAVAIRDATSGDVLRTVDERLSWVVEGAVSPDGERIVLGDVYGALSVCDASTGDLLMTLGDSFVSARTCAMSSDGRYIMTGSSARRGCIWDGETGDLLRRLDWRDIELASCAMSSDGRRIVSGSIDGTVRVWDALTGDVLRTCAAFDVSLRNISISQDGKHIMAVSYRDTACVWDANNGKVRMRFDAESRDSQSASLIACTMSPDDRHVVAALSDGTLRIKRMTTGVVRTLGEPGEPSSVCSASPDGRRLVFGGFDGTLSVWDLSRARLMFRLTDCDAAIMACAVSSEGRRILAGASDGKLRVWNGVSGELLLTLPGHYNGVAECAISTDGHRLVSLAGDGISRVWDGTTGMLLRTIVQFDDADEAVFDEVPTRRIRRATPGAWRWLGWLGKDPETGAVRRYPAESFGPLPGAE